MGQGNFIGPKNIFFKDLEGNPNTKVNQEAYSKKWTPSKYITITVI